MLKKITFLTNYNLYESKRHFTAKLAEALKRKGVDVQILDVQELALNASAIGNLVRQQPQLTCSFNSILPISKDRYLWDELEIPHLSILVDPAIYSLDLVRSPYSILSCVDKFDCQTLVNQGAKNVFFFPHAIERELSGDHTSDRPYDIVLLGSCYDIEEVRRKWQEKYPEAIGKAIEEATEITLSKMEIPFPHALAEVLQNLHTQINPDDMLEILTYLDFYSRGKDRLELVKGMKNFKVHVFGDVQMGKNGWKHYLKDMPNVEIHNPVAFNESLEILKKSKFCLNSMPFFKNGSHERIFTALACGAIPITTENLFVRDLFVDGKDLLTYRYGDLNLLNDHISSLLANESKHREIAASGREIVMRNHTWDTRADQLMKELPAMITNVYAS